MWARGREYIVTGDLTVGQGVTLRIQPQVRIAFKADSERDYCGITVEGTLIADGEDSTTAILFTSGKEDWNRRPGDWRGIEIKATSGRSSVMRYCCIEYAHVGIKVNRSSPEVTHCVVEHCVDTGILFYRSDWGEVTWCIIRENKRGIWFELVEDGKIERCVVKRNDHLGIGYRRSSLAMRNNVVKNNGQGVWCEDASLSIKHNEIQSNKVGILLMGSSPLISFNLIKNIECDVQVGSTRNPLLSAQPVISSNNIDGGRWLIRYFDSNLGANVDARGNSWGTAEVSEIYERILDGHDIVDDKEPWGTVGVKPVM